jgi:hypothetical protein
MPHLVQILLPLRDNEDRPFGPEPFGLTRAELARRFGGVTAYVNAPAEGVWREGGEEDRDRIVLFEVMDDDLDRSWWRAYRETLRLRFRQEELVVRAVEMERL